MWLSYAEVVDIAKDVLVTWQGTQDPSRHEQQWNRVRILGKVIFLVVALGILGDSTGHDPIVGSCLHHLVLTVEANLAV